LTSTTPSGLLAILLASGGNFLLPILLSAAQLATSRLWPDSDIPRDIERAKVVVNVAGAAATSLVAALKRWRHARKAVVAAADEALAAVEAASAVIAATERTALLADRARSSTRRAGEKRRVRFPLDASLIDVSTKDDDQAQIAILHPIS
jgi:hypothetical protein